MLHDLHPTDGTAACIERRVAASKRVAVAVAGLGHMAVACRTPTHPKARRSSEPSPSAHDGSGVIYATAA